MTCLRPRHPRRCCHHGHPLAPPRWHVCISVFRRLRMRHLLRFLAPSVGVPAPAQVCLPHVCAVCLSLTGHRPPAVLCIRWCRAFCVRTWLLVCSADASARPIAPLFPTKWGNEHCWGAAGPHPWMPPPPPTVSTPWPSPASPPPPPPPSLLPVAGLRRPPPRPLPPSAPHFRQILGVWSPVDRCRPLPRPSTSLCQTPLLSTGPPRVPVVHIADTSLGCRCCSAVQSNFDPKASPSPRIQSHVDAQGWPSTVARAMI